MTCCHSTQAPKGGLFGLFGGSGKASVDVSLPKVDVPKGNLKVDVSLPKVDVPKGNLKVDVSLPKVDVPKGNLKGKAELALPSGSVAVEVGDAWSDWLGFVMLSAEQVVLEVQPHQALRGQHP